LEGRELAYSPPPPVLPEIQAHIFFPKSTGIDFISATPHHEHMPQRIVLPTLDFFRGPKNILKVPENGFDKNQGGRSIKTFKEDLCVA